MHTSRSLNGRRENVREELGALPEPLDGLLHRGRDVEARVAAHLAELERAVAEDLVVRVLEVRRRRGEDVGPGLGVALVPGHEHPAVVADRGGLVHRGEEARADGHVARGDRGLFVWGECEAGEEEGDDGLFDCDGLSEDERELGREKWLREDGPFFAQRASAFEKGLACLVCFVQLCLRFIASHSHETQVFLECV